MEALKNKPKVTFVPSSYTAMDDIFIPDPPFPYKVTAEDYKFTPIIFKLNYSEKDKFENDTYIYLQPSYSTNVNQLEDIASTWQLQVNRESNALLSVQRKGTVNLAGTEAYELIYITVGYDDDRDRKNRYIERVYFIPVDDKQVAAVRLVRDVEDDNQTTDFWTDSAPRIAACKA